MGHAQNEHDVIWMERPKEKCLPLKVELEDNQLLEAANITFSLYQIHFFSLSFSPHGPHKLGNLSKLKA